MTEDANALYNFALDANDKQQTFDIDAFIEDFFGFEPDFDTLRRYYLRFAPTLDPMGFYISDLERQSVLDDIHDSNDFEEIDRMVQVGRNIDAIIDNDYDAQEPLMWFNENRHQFLSVSYQKFIDTIED